MPVFIKGVINLRGKVIPVMDIRSRFNLENRDYDDRTCIIVVSVDKLLVGIVVDTVSEVLDIPPDDIGPPPKVTKNYNDDLIQGLGKVGGGVKILLNINAMLGEKEYEELNQSVKSE